MAKTPGGKNIVNAVRETLDSVVTPSVRDTILARALTAAKREELPTDPGDLEEFLQGALHDSLIRALGPELGLSVSTELERIALLARRDTPREQPRSLARPEAAREQPRLVGRKETPREHARLVTRKDTLREQSRIALQPETVRPGARDKPAPSVGKRKLPRSTMPSPDVLPPGSAVASDQRWADNERRGIAPTLPAGRPFAESRGPGHPSPRGPGATSKGPSPTSADYPRGVAKALGVIGSASIEPRPSSRPTVLLASTDPDLIGLFSAWLDGRATVETTSSTTQLVTRLTQPGSRIVIVFDGKHPGVRPLTVAALADEFPPGTSVILWGVQAHLHARMCSIAAAAEKWTVYAGDATSNEVVAECARIVS